MTSIYTVVPDVNALLQRKGWLTPDLSQYLSRTISNRMQVRFNDTRGSKLGLSGIGRYVCPRALWCSVHKPEEAVPLPSHAILKYSYGDILEALVLTMIKAAGHEVVGEQDECCVDGIYGHRDCVVDGLVCDVKSSSTRGMDKFTEGTLEASDLFGYLEQLDGYLAGGQQDSLVRVKDKGFIFAVDLQLGHLASYEHKFRGMERTLQKVAECKRVLSLTTPPTCMCRSVPENLSGNMKLDIPGSYNSFKYFCNPKLRTFIMSKGPIYFTRVVREPNGGKEVDRHGNPV